jgi:hypothetical protein
MAIGNAIYNFIVECQYFTILWRREAELFFLSAGDSALALTYAAPCSLYVPRLRSLSYQTHCQVFGQAFGQATDAWQSCVPGSERNPSC